MADKNGLVLAIRDVRKGFGSVPVLSIDNFELNRGEQVAIAGPSGAGKTTFLNLVSGILDCDKGSVLVDGTDITKLSGRQRDAFRGSKIGIVFQTFNLLQGFSALNNLMVALLFGKIPKRDHETRAMELLRRVGLADYKHRKPAELSVGQQQRIAIARALANNPPLILADEPAAQLDAANAENVINLLKQTCREGNHTLIVVAHDQIVLSKFEKVIDIREFASK
jgi:putative ABC transport system ATP-binding protein